MPHAGYLMPDLYGQDHPAAEYAPVSYTHLDVYKRQWLTHAEVKLKLRESCDDLGFAKCHPGWGQLNVKKLLS